MRPFAVSVTSTSFGVVKDLPVRLPAVSLVKPPLASEKEPSPLRLCSPPSQCWGPVTAGKPQVFLQFAGSFARGNLGAVLFAQPACAVR